MTRRATLTTTDKAQLKNALIELLNEELSLARMAADEAKSSATSLEAKSENKYDTRSTEAAYLAHGQSLRAQTLLDLITQISEWSLGADHQGHQDSHQSIGLGSLVCLRQGSDEHPGRWVWITPVGARQIELGGVKVQVVNAQAPLAQQLIGLEIDDTARVMNAEWLITEVV
jgi:transcription elongation GreA/GreB family factor